MGLKVSEVRYSPLRIPDSRIRLSVSERQRRFKMRAVNAGSLLEISGYHRRLS